VTNPFDLKASAEQIARMRASGTLPPLPRPPSVWIAYSGEYQDRRVEGVFTTRGAAVRRWAMHYRWTWPGLLPSLQGKPLFDVLGQADVEECDVDPPDPVD
jgi:hypothetical protein